jgi:hypothetical protein
VGLLTAGGAASGRPAAPRARDAALKAPSSSTSSFLAAAASSFDILGAIVLRTIAGEPFIHA